MWPCWCIGWFDNVVVSCLVSSVHFNCIVQYSLHRNMDRYHVTLYISQQLPITVYRSVLFLFLFFILFVCLSVCLFLCLFCLLFFFFFFFWGGGGGGGVLFWCWVSLSASLTIFLIEFYLIMIFIMIVVTIIGIFMVIHCFFNYTLDLMKLSSYGYVNAQLLGCFRPWTPSLNAGLNMQLSDSFMSCLHSLLGYSTGEFHALQLIVLVAFGAVD